MAQIFESEHFIVESSEKPLVTRTDGGHIRILPKIRLVDRQQFTPRQAIEFMRLTMVVGEAMNLALNKHGIDIGRINYEDLGNWQVLAPEGPYFHYHLFGRAKRAKIQPYGEALAFPLRSRYPEFYEKNEPLTAKDVVRVKEEMKELFKKLSYSDKAWGLDRQ